MKPQLFTTEPESEKPDPLIAYWNSLRFVTHHVHPSAVRYKASRLLMYFRHGELPVSRIWAEKAGIPQDLLSASWTDEEVRLMMRGISKSLDPAYLPADKPKLSRTLKDCLLSPNGACAFLFVYVHPPRHNPDEALSPAQKSGVQYLTETVFGNRADTDTKPLRSLVLDVYAWQETITVPEEPVAHDVFADPAQIVHAFADYTDRKYHDFQNLAPHMLLFGGKIWTAFITDTAHDVGLSQNQLTGLLSGFK